MFALNKFSRIAIIVIIGLTPISYYASSAPTYHILENAVNSIRLHQTNPSSTTDPLIDSRKGYITLPNTPIDSIDDARFDLIIESETIIYNRKVIQDKAREALVEELKSAIETEDSEAIQQAYENYHKGYRDRNSLTMAAIDNQILDISLTNNKSIFNSTVTNHSQYRQATVNFISAYIQDTSDRRDNLYNEIYANRMERLVSLNERVNPVFNVAQNFSDNCSACELPVRVVAPEPNPIIPTPVIIPPPVYIEPDCVNIIFDEGRYSLVRCP
jgi:hypothetical protein